MDDRIINALREVIHELSDDAPRSSWKQLVRLAPDYLGRATDQEAADAYGQLSRADKDRLLTKV